jgi:hypothetical protein
MFSQKSDWLQSRTMGRKVGGNRPILWRSFPNKKPSLVSWTGDGELQDECLRIMPKHQNSYNNIFAGLQAEILGDFVCLRLWVVGGFIPRDSADERARIT